MSEMDRRDFVKTLVVGGAMLGTLQAAGAVGAQEKPQAQTAKDPNNMTATEAHHVPKIEPANAAPKAGEPLPIAITIEHPMLPEHHIIHIEVFMDDQKIGTYTLTPEVMKPSLTVTLTPKKSFELVVQDLCNIHGLWENRKKIEVA